MVSFAAAGHSAVQLGLMFDSPGTRSAGLNGLAGTHALKGDVGVRDGRGFLLHGFNDRRVALAGRGKLFQLVDLGCKLLTVSQVSGCVK